PRGRRRPRGRRAAGTSALRLRLTLPRIAHRRLAERARRLLDPRLQFGFRARDRVNVLLGLAAFRRARTLVELPGGDDNFFLRVDEVVDAVLAAAAWHAALALRQRELLLVRLHLEEEDVAARFARPRAARQVAGTGVVRDEIARLDVEIFEEQRVTRIDQRVAAVDPERHGLLRAAADGVDEIEAVDAVVVFR